MLPEIMKNNSLKYYIGTSGWVYSHWKERFYPTSLSQSHWLEFYTQHFDSVELNNSFYHLPSEKAFLHWKQTTPAGFKFAVKVSRFITHLKKLKNVETSLENFFSRARFLEEKLGPLLYQIPPQLPRNDALLGDFLKLLPTEFQHVFEFRNPTWMDSVIFRLLQKHNAGFCVFDMPDFRCPVLSTADYAYFRFHGSTALYSSCYSDGELREWADKIQDIAKSVRAVYVYFNNDAEGYAIKNALMLREILEGS